MTDQDEEQLDRARCACLFGIDEGELGDEPWEGFAYWYEGVPEWAADDFSRDERNSPSGRYRTVIRPLLSGARDMRVPEGWHLAKLYNSAPERECAWCGPGTGNEDSRAECKLCEGDGLLYWGEEWCEVVLEQPLFDPPDLAEKEDTVFLGSSTHTPDDQEDSRCDLWATEVSGETVYTAVFSADWPGELSVTERMLRKNPKLVEAWPWIADALRLQQERKDPS